MEEEFEEMADRKNAAHVLFFRPARYEALATLAINGPMTVRELARAIGSDASGTFVMVQSFIEAGILYKSDKPGHRKYVALDRKYFAFEELRDLLLRLDKKYPVARTEGSGFRTSFPSRRTGRHKRHGEPDTLFGSEGRTKILTVMRRAGSLSRDQMIRICHLSMCGAQKPMDAFRECKIVKQTGRYGLRKPYYLNPKWFAYHELARLLDRIAEYEEFFEGLAINAVRDGSHDLANWGPNVLDFTGHRKEKLRGQGRKRLAS